MAIRVLPNQIQLVVNIAVKAVFWDQGQHIETIDCLHFDIDETRRALVHPLNKQLPVYFIKVRRGGTGNVFSRRGMKISTWGLF